MNILAIETATEACSAALLVDKNKVITRFKLAPREHTKLILPMMEEVLKEGGVEKKDIDAIAFSCGPGAFTGLRIAAGIAQGVALSIDKPVVPVSTLAALALSAVKTDELVEGDWIGNLIVAALDARMGEIYWGIYVYLDDTIRSLGEERVSKPEELEDAVVRNLSLLEEYTNLFAIGSGWDAYEEKLFKNDKPKKIIHIKSAYPSADLIATLAKPMLIKGKALPVEEAQPVYIRNKVADKPKKKAE